MPCTEAVRKRATRFYLAEHERRLTNIVGVSDLTILIANSKCIANAVVSAPTHSVLLREASIFGMEERSPGIPELSFGLLLVQGRRLVESPSRRYLFI